MDGRAAGARDAIGSDLPENGFDEPGKLARWKVERDSSKYLRAGTRC
jgi:hypothetical protein